MPAGSEVPLLPHTWRPLGVRVAGSVLGGALLLVCVVAWFAFPADIRAQFTPFQRGTLVALGLLAFATGFALTRSRLVAEPERLVVVNGYRRRELAWAQVVEVRLPPGAPWATLDLTDGTTAPVMAIQGSDGERARDAVRALRALLDQPHLGGSEA